MVAFLTRILIALGILSFRMATVFAIISPVIVLYIYWKTKRSANVTLGEEDLSRRILIEDIATTETDTEEDSEVNDEEYDELSNHDSGFACSSDNSSLDRYEVGYLYFIVW